MISASLSGASPDAEGLRTDERLARPVTISGARLFVAEVAGELTRQTGVKIEADEGSGAADARVLVAVKDVPAWRVMDALQGLFSYKLALWRWERTEQHPTTGYRFVQTRAAQGLASRLGALAQRAFEDDAAARIEAARLSDEERAGQLNDPTPMTLQELRPWGARVFAECVPPDLQDAILRGERAYEIPVAGLPRWAQLFVEDTSKTVRFGTQLPDGSRHPVRPSSTIRLWADRIGLDAVPTLWIGLEGIGSRDYFGGPRLERRFREDLQQLWLGAGDARADPKLESVVLQDPQPGAGPGGQVPFIHRCLMECAARSAVPVIGRLPYEHATLPGGLPVERGVSLGRYIAVLGESYAALRCKWRQGILLVGYHSWFVRDEELYRAPWRIVHRLRNAAAARGGMVPPAEVARAAAEMSPMQLRALADDWPSASSVLCLQTALACVARDSRALKSLATTGRATLQGGDARQAALGLLSDVGTIERVARVLVKATESGSGESRRADWFVAAYDQAGAELGRSGFLMEPGTP